MGNGQAAPRASQNGMVLDVGIVVPDNLVVRGSDIRPPNGSFSVGDMNVTLGGDFRVRKQAGADPVMIGTIRTARGTYEFQGRRFEIERDGEIRFLGKQPPDPALDVNARREISGILAQVHVGGTVREPTLDLSSDPPLEDAEILALIVFNQPLNQLSEGQRLSLADRAGTIATGFVVSPLAESLGRALDLDIFEVTGFGDQTSGPRVRVGEQVGEKVFVSLEQGLGAQEVTQFMLEYQLNDLLRLKGSLAEGISRPNHALTRRVEGSGIDLVLLIRY